MHPNKIFSATFFTKSEKLRVALIAIIIGILLAKFEFFPNVILLIGGIGLVLSIFWRKFWIGMLAAFLLANFYGQWRNFHDFRDDQLVNHINEEVELSGTITSFPDTREKSNRAYVRISALSPLPSGEGQGEGKSLGTLLLVVPPDTELNYGDEIKFTGKITRPRSFTGFDYMAFLKRYGAQTIVRNPQEFETLSSGTGGNPLLRTAKTTRDFLAHNLRKALPEPHSTIAMGVLLGVKNQLPDFTAQDFKNSGLQHLLIVSGTNVTIVIIFISILLRRFGRRAMFAGSMGALIFFVAMTGADAPVLRSAIMGAVVGLAAVMGKFSDARNLVLLSAAIIGIFDPKIVQSDVGFFLSFAATLGIVLGTPVLMQTFRKVTDVFELRSLLAVSIGAQIAVMPVLGYFFGNFPVSGLLSNLIAGPLVPFSMLFSFTATILGAGPVIFAKIIGIPAFVVLEALLQVAKFFGQFPLLTVSKSFAVAIGVLVVGFFGWAIFSRKFEEKYLRKVDEKFATVAEKS